jgi:hypothetical protein
MKVSLFVWLLGISVPSFLLGFFFMSHDGTVYDNPGEIGSTHMRRTGMVLSFKYAAEFGSHAATGRTLMPLRQSIL